MVNPLINILIRTHRPHTLPACLQSIKNDNYPNKKVHVYDGTGYGNGFEYNLLCNKLKDGIDEGWIFYLDDDDVLITGRLEEISRHLNDDDYLVICQFMRGSRPKPLDELMDERAIIRGYIGLPCMFIHSKHKDIGQFVATEDADYRFINEASKKLKTKFIKIPVVSSPKRSFGK